MSATKIDYSPIAYLTSDGDGRIRKFLEGEFLEDLNCSIPFLVEGENLDSIFFVLDGEVLEQPGKM
jgi:hypothetical protein